MTKIRTPNLDLIVGDSDTDSLVAPDILANFETLDEEVADRYEKPEDGVPLTDLDPAVRTSLAKADSAVQPGALGSALAAKYEKPSLGIPATDLTAAAQTALSEAGTAVQPGDAVLADKADLDPDTGKLVADQLPPIPTVQWYSVNSQAAMLALSVSPGSGAIRSDVSKTFVLKAGGSPGTLADWIELPVPVGVSSVNTRTGAVTGLAEQSALAAEAAARQLGDAEVLTFIGNVVPNVLRSRCKMRVVSGAFPPRVRPAENNRLKVVVRNLDASKTLEYAYSNNANSNASAPSTGWLPIPPGYELVDWYTTKQLFVRVAGTGTSTHVDIYTEVSL